MDESKKNELIKNCGVELERISDALDTLKCPHIFIFLNLDRAEVGYFSGGAVLQLLFLSLATVMKTFLTDPDLRPIIKPLYWILKQELESEVKKADPEMAELNEAFREIFERVAKDEEPKKQG